MAKRRKENRFFPLLFGVFKNTGRSLNRNEFSGSSIASVISMVAALILLGIFVIISVNITHITENVESALELKIFLVDNYTEVQKTDLEKILLENEMIKSISFESKEEAFNEFSKSLKDHAGLLKGYGYENNPMPASFIVKVKDPQNLQAVKTFSEKYTEKGVDHVKYGEEYVNLLMNFSNASKIFILIFLVLFSFASLFFIYNTIKLTCFSRRREIRVMKYVGATDWYIRIPFILEGTCIGLVSALVALLIVRTSYYLMIGYSSGDVYLPLNSTLVDPSAVMLPMTPFFIGYGIVIGSLGSAISIRKFLDA